MKKTLEDRMIREVKTRMWEKQKRRETIALIIFGILWAIAITVWVVAL